MLSDVKSDFSVKSIKRCIKNAKMWTMLIIYGKRIDQINYNVNATANYVRSGQRVNQHSEHECDFFLHLVQIAKMRVLMGQPIVAI